MKLKVVILAAALLGAASSWAQSASQASPAALRSTASPKGLASMALRNGGMRMAPQVRGPEALFEERLQDMQDTLAQMHALLKQMQAKAGSKDQIAVVNIRMWELMLGHLDKTLLQARQTAMQRAAMYQNAMPGAAGASHAVSLPAAPK